MQGEAATAHKHGPARAEVRPLQPNIGAEIVGIDLRQPIDEGAKQVLRDALLKYGVIFLSRQMIDDDQYVRFAEVFGEVLRGNGNGDGEARPPVSRLTAKMNEGANVWHSDGCYMAAPPNMTMLHAVTAPLLGGDTCFSSAVAAYAGLPEDLKERIKPMRYRSSFGFIIGRGLGRFGPRNEFEEQAKKFPAVEQPVVRVHPETGAHVLYVNDSQTIDIVGLEPEESAALLRTLTDEIKKPEYQVRWKWGEGDIAAWDNRAVQHYGVPNQIGERVMARITLLGEPAIAAA
jgi:taurine dioxygenase